MSQVLRKLVFVVWPATTQYCLSSEQERCWSDCTDVEADLLLCCCTCFSMGDLGVQVSVRLSVCLSVCPFVRPSVNIYPGCLVSPTPLTVLYQSFWNFGGVFIMVWGCACGLDIIVRLFFCHFFHFVNLVIFPPQCIDSGYLVSTTPHTILYRSFLNFVHVFSMVWRCACGLDVMLALIFVTFSALGTLSFSDLRFYESVVTVGTLWAQLLIQFYTYLFETLHMFSPWSGDVHVVWI